MNNLTHYHKRLGKHSNIPDCCIREWLYDVDMIHGSRKISMIALRELQVPGSMRYFSTHPTLNYVPCKRCMERLLAEEIVPAAVHMCNRNDPVCQSYLRLVP